MKKAIKTMKKTKKKPKKKLEIGDKILVMTRTGQEQGIFLESHEPGVLLLKLDSGYNIGIKRKDIKKIKILEKRKEEKKQEAKIDVRGKPRIDLIMTGGTISSKLDSKTGGVKALTDAKELFAMYPGIFDVADIKVIVPFTKLSENMSSQDWIKIAKLTAKSLNDPRVRGVIITHGTDTLHYTASALSFMLQTSKPVVLTYSQRSSDRGSSDARLNLICSARTALSDIAEVSLVGHASMNDDFCYILKGSKVRKMHSSRRDTFRPINCKPIGKIWEDGRIEKISDFRKRQKGKTDVDAVFEDRVALLKFYPGQNPKILDAYKNYKGIVIEMTGLGHVATERKSSWIPAIRELIKKGIFVCAVPQTLYGRLDPYVYSSGRELLKLGVIYLEDMLPETALVKLGWILAHKKWDVKEKMLENIAGELNPKLGGEFLI